MKTSLMTPLPSQDSLRTGRKEEGGREGGREKRREERNKQMDEGRKKRRNKGRFFYLIFKRMNKSRHLWSFVGLF